MKNTLFILISRKRSYNKTIRFQMFLAQALNNIKNYTPSSLSTIVINVSQAITYVSPSQLQIISSPHLLCFPLQEAAAVASPRTLSPSPSAGRRPLKPILKKTNSFRLRCRPREASRAGVSPYATVTGGLGDRRYDARWKWMWRVMGGHREWKVRQRFVHGSVVHSLILQSHVR